MNSVLWTEVTSNPGPNTCCPGIEVGMNWFRRIQVSEEGVHRPPVAGISGRAEEGCQSIVLAGGYEDDEDNGDFFTYTGSGGRDLSGNKRTAGQTSDQKLDKAGTSDASPITDNNLHFSPTLPLPGTARPPSMPWTAEMPETDGRRGNRSESSETPRGGNTASTLQRLETDMTVSRGS